MKRLHIILVGDRRGATAAEFAMVLPLLLLLLFGIIDGGRLMWSMNRAEKATQMGARMAVVTDMVPTGLYDADFSATLSQGVPVPDSSFGGALCTKSGSIVSCSCDGVCPALTPINNEAFERIAARVRNFYPEASDANIQVEYRNSGLGYSGDPNGADVAPITTVRLTGLRFQPLLLTIFGGGFDLPDFNASLTGEDFSGDFSN